jgi:hypothetical protein
MGTNAPKEKPEGLECPPPPPPAPPKAPLLRHVTEGVHYKHCPKCKSSMKKDGFLGLYGTARCIQPQCGYTE